MTREVITISRDGKVAIPVNPQMTDFEIAELFGVFVSKIKAQIRIILKEGICFGDYSNGGVVGNSKIYPDYYGLDMIIALAFRVHSYEADIFRRWVLKRITTHQNQLPQIFIQLPHNQVYN